MSLHGHTRIELADATTGEIVKVVEEDNIVTNALTNLINTDYCGRVSDLATTCAGAIEYINKTSTSCDYGFTYDGEYFSRSGYALFSPLMGNAVGGIKLFANQIEEDADTIYQPSSAEVTGYASMITNSEAVDIKRGSFLPDDSGFREGDTGYDFVWNFNADQANGPISCVCLTDKLGGLCEKPFTNVLAGVDSYCGYYLDTKNAGAMWNAVVTPYAIDIDYTTKTITRLTLTSNTTVNITKIAFDYTPTSKRSVFRGKNNSKGMKVISSVDITFAENITGNWTSAKLSNVNAHDGGDGYIYIIGYDCTSSPSGSYVDHNSNNDNLRIHKINKTDYSYEYSYYKYTSADAYVPRFYLTTYRNGEPYSYCGTSIVRNGYLYIGCADKGTTTFNKIAKIQLSNLKNLIIIEDGSHGINSSSWNSLYFTAWFKTLNNDIIIPRISGSNNKQCIIDINDTIFMTPFDTNLQYYTFNGSSLNNGHYVNNGSNAYSLRMQIPNSPIAVRFAGKTINKYWNDLITYEITNGYLVTINNLATPVIKNNQQTMKIYYSLYEEED